MQQAVSHPVSNGVFFPVAVVYSGMFERDDSLLNAGRGRIAAIILLWLCAVGLAAAGETRLHSGPARTVMIELYTSEGCSSCPPAEKYLNTYVNHPRLWTTYIPLALHVDYWDYLGWKDRFARAGNTERQHRYAQLAGARTVYTPAFVVNGVLWRPGMFRRTPEPDTLSAAETAGDLSVRVRDGRFQARYVPVTDNPKTPLVFHIAVLGMGLETDIQAGENRGRQSRHDFVLLSHQQLSSSDLAWQGDLPATSEFKAPAYSLAAWVSRVDDPTPLQATGGRYLP